MSTSPTCIDGTLLTRPTEQPALTICDWAAFSVMPTTPGSTHWVGVGGAGGCGALAPVFVRVLRARCPVLLRCDRHLAGNLASVPEPEDREDPEQQTREQHRDPGPHGDRRDGPPAVGVQQHGPQGLTLEQGVCLALQLRGDVGVDPLFARCCTRLRVGCAVVDAHEVSADVAGERLCLHTVLDLLTGELTDLGPLLRRHRFGRREGDVLRHQAVAHVLLTEVATVDSHRAERDEHDRDHGTCAAHDLVPVAPVHRLLLAPGAAAPMGAR